MAHGPGSGYGDKGKSDRVGVVRRLLIPVESLSSLLEYPY